MLFDGWHDLVRILVVGIAAYAALIVVLRATGKRTLSKMNAFDLVVTVALGSTLSSALLDSSVSLSEAVLAFVVLAGLQFAVTFASVRSKRVGRAVKADPTLVFFEGRMIDAALTAQRVTPDEVLAAIRGAGHASPEAVTAVVLETDGSFSVLTGSPSPDRGSLVTVAGMPPAGPPRSGSAAPAGNAA